MTIRSKPLHTRESRVLGAELMAIPRVVAKSIFSESMDENAPDDINCFIARSAAQPFLNQTRILHRLSRPSTNG